VGLPPPPLLVVRQLEKYIFLGVPSLRCSEKVRETYVRASNGKDIELMNFIV